MTENEKQLCKVLGAILRKEPLQITKEQAVQYFAEAYGLGITHLLYNPFSALCNPAVDCPLVAKKEYSFVMENAAQWELWNKTARAFEEAGVDVLMLKGIYLREFYPDPEARLMTDIDLLYRPKQKRKMKKVMGALGYTLFEADSRHRVYHHHEYKTGVEMHHTVENEDDFGNPFYIDMFERAEHWENYRHILHMSFKDLFIQTIIHIKSHILCGEYELRQLCDVYVLLLHNRNILSECEDVLQSMGVATFARRLREICFFLFEENGESKDFLDPYGVADAFLGHRAKGARQLQVTPNSSANKIYRILRGAFPKRVKIYLAFPLVRRYKILLPFGYLVRLLQALGIRKNNAKSQMRLAQIVTENRNSKQNVWLGL